MSCVDSLNLIGLGDSLVYTIDIQIDKENDIVTFSNGSTFLKLFEVRGVERMVIQSNSFLEVSLVTRGGSGTRLRRTVLICVSKGKLCRALDVLSCVSSRLLSVFDSAVDSLKMFKEEENYYLIIEISKSRESYLATITEVNKVDSKKDPLLNESNTYTLELVFDSDGNFFFNTLKDLNKAFTIKSGRTSYTDHVFAGKSVPAVRLHYKSYLVIGSEWYLENRDGTLSLM